MAQDGVVGVITEQGDLGLGFDPIKPQEQKIIKENEQQKAAAQEQKTE